MIGRRRLQDVSDLHETVVVLVDNGKALPVQGRDQIDERLFMITFTDIIICGQSKRNLTRDGQTPSAKSNGTLAVPNGRDRRFGV